jgi:O-antigen ligase/polysaccharide polymerase Wzy-like membrane protein
VKLGWLDWLLLLTLSVLTYEKLSWSTSVVTLTWTNLLAVAFVVAFVVDRVRRRDTLLHPAAVTLVGFMIAFAAVYLAGYFDLTDKAALQYWLKGLGAWGIHFTYLVLGVAHMVRRGGALYIRAIYAFTAGMVVNCIYGILQLGLQVGAGINLDRIVVGTLTAGQGGVGGINVYGTVAGSQHVYRINALTGDPNHLGVMLCVPLMLLLPYYLGDRQGRRRIGLVLLFMFAVQVLTLSRSAALGDIAGLAVLLPQLRRFLPRLRTLAIGVGAVAAAFGALYASSHFVRAVIASRTQVNGGGTQTHLQFYQLVPPALDPHPLFGMGFNTFAVYYQFVTGRSDFGPHSAWIAILVETGLVGMAVYLAYFGYLLASADRIRRAADRDVGRLGHGLLAALVATAAGNLFYLTMTFDYFFAVALLAVAGSAMFGPARALAPARAPAPAGSAR